MDARGGETEAGQNESVRGQSKRYPIGTQIKTEGGVSLNLNATFYTNRPSLRFECKSMLGRKSSALTNCHQSERGPPPEKSRHYSSRPDRTSHAKR